MTPEEATSTALEAILAAFRSEAERFPCVEIRGVDYDDAYQFAPGDPCVVFGTLASPTLRSDEGEIVLLTPAATAMPRRPAAEIEACLIEIDACREIVERALYTGLVESQIEHGEEGRVVAVLNRARNLISPPRPRPRPS